MTSGGILKTLRQPRYAALSMLMLIVAIACVLAGTWQVSRFEQKVHENDVLRGNAHAAPTSAATLLPLTGSILRTPSARSIQFRQVTATGTYDAVAQTLVRNIQVNDDIGYYVLAPFSTNEGTLLVARGFISSQSSVSPKIPPPPTGTVTITVRLQPADTRQDNAASLPKPQVESINPADEAARLGRPVFRAYGELLAGQPGTSGLTAIPSPDLSNPAGGALEPQHFAYIIQWYLFAALAVAAPFAMARSETRQRRRGELDTELEFEPVKRGRHAKPVEDEPVEQELTPEQARAAKLADRYSG